MVIRGDVKLNSSPGSGTGDPILTRDATSGIVGEVGAIDVSVYLPTTLTSGNVYIGNGSNVATSTALTGDVVVSNTGVTSISSGVIVNADVNASAAITLTKLAATTASRALVSDASGFISPSSVTSTEIGYVGGVTSSIQTQLDSKQATITGGATTIVSSNLTVSRLLVSDGSGKVAASSVTSTEAGYLSGVTSSIQTQLSAKQSSIQFEDEGVSIGTLGGVVSVDFVGAGVTASHSGGTVTVTIPGTANGLPTGGTAGQVLIKDSGTDYDATFQNLTLAEVTDVTASTAEVNILTGATLTTTELNYVDGVTSNIQTQLDTKLLNNLAQNAIWVGDASNQATQVAPGANGYVLTSVGGLPSWSPASGGSGGHAIQDAGVAVPVQPNLNFERFTLTDDVGNTATVVTRPPSITMDVTAPSAPLAGDEWVDTTDTIWKRWVYYDSYWVEIPLSGGGSTPGGSDTQVQYNDAGAFGGDAAFTYNKTTNVLTVDGINLTGETASRFVTTDASKNLDTPYTFIDDDTMATASATAIPSSESVKAYVDSIIISAEYPLAVSCLTMLSK